MTVHTGWSHRSFCENLEKDYLFHLAKASVALVLGHPQHRMHSAPTAIFVLGHPSTCQIHFQLSLLPVQLWPYLKSSEGVSFSVSEGIGSLTLTKASGRIMPKTQILLVNFKELPEQIQLPYQPRMA